VEPKQVRKLVYGLYVRAGLVKEPKGRMFELRTHSLRKFFKTNMSALGVQSDYVDYFMGHVPDTYHDIQSLGIDKLRNICAAAGLAIRIKTQVSKVDALKEIIGAWGMNPEQLLTKDALAEGAATYKSQEDFENHELTVLSSHLKELIRRETTG